MTLQGQYVARNRPNRVGGLAGWPQIGSRLAEVGDNGLKFGTQERTPLKLVFKEFFQPLEFGLMEE